MCTAISYLCKDHYFGRNLDLEYSYSESITVTPRSYPFVFRHVPSIKQHLAMIGMAYIQNDYPLYYDATNEAGLSMAGLSFPENAAYSRLLVPGKDNIASFELIPWILSQCNSVQEATTLLSHLQLVNTAFLESLPPSPLHWLLADREQSLVIEAMADGLHIHDNPTGVLTNNPPFDYQLFSLNNFLSLSRDPPNNHFSDKLKLTNYSRGMGALGLPGDFSSQSRFIRACFVKLNVLSSHDDTKNLSQFFHILSSVSQPKGCIIVPDAPDPYEYTIYSSCCNTSRGIYYYSTYDNPQINAVDMHLETLHGTQLIAHPLKNDMQVLLQNPSSLSENCV